MPRVVADHAVVLVLRLAGRVAFEDVRDRHHEVGRNGPGIQQ